MFNSTANAIGVGDSALWSIISGNLKVDRNHDINSDSSRMAKLADRKLDPMKVKRFNEKFKDMLNKVSTS